MDKGFKNNPGQGQLRQYSFRRVSGPLENTNSLDDDDDGGFQKFNNYHKILSKRSATLKHQQVNDNILQQFRSVSKVRGFNKLKRANSSEYGNSDAVSSSAASALSHSKNSLGPHASKQPYQNLSQFARQSVFARDPRSSAKDAHLSRELSKSSSSEERKQDLDQGIIRPSIELTERQMEESHDFLMDFDLSKASPMAKSQQPRALDLAQGMKAQDGFDPSSPAAIQNPMSPITLQKQVEAGAEMPGLSPMAPTSRTHSVIENLNFWLKGAESPSQSPEQSAIHRSTISIKGFSRRKLNLGENFFQIERDLDSIMLNFVDSSVPDANLESLAELFHAEKEAVESLLKAKVPPSLKDIESLKIVYKEISGKVREFELALMLALGVSAILGIFSLIQFTWLVAAEDAPQLLAAVSFFSALWHWGWCCATIISGKRLKLYLDDLVGIKESPKQADFLILSVVICTFTGMSQLLGADAIERLESDGYDVAGFAVLVQLAGLLIQINLLGSVIPLLRVKQLKKVEWIIFGSFWLNVERIILTTQPAQDSLFLAVVVALAKVGLAFLFRQLSKPTHIVFKTTSPSGMPGSMVSSPEMATTQIEASPYEKRITQSLLPVPPKIAQEIQQELMQSPKFSKESMARGVGSLTDSINPYQMAGASPAIAIKSLKDIDYINITKSEQDYSVTHQPKLATDLEEFFHIFGVFFSGAMLCGVTEKPFELSPTELKRSTMPFNQSVRYKRTRNRSVARQPLLIDVLKISPDFFTKLFKSAGCDPQGKKNPRILSFNDQYSPSGIHFDMTRSLQKQKSLQEVARKKHTSIVNEFRQVSFNNLQLLGESNAPIKDSQQSYSVKLEVPKSTKRKGENHNDTTDYGEILEQYEQRKDLLYIKVFEPHLISNQTKLQFQDQYMWEKRNQRTLKLSLVDIIEQFNKSAKMDPCIKLYFKVDGTRISAESIRRHSSKSFAFDKINSKPTESDKGRNNNPFSSIRRQSTMKPQKMSKVLDKQKSDTHFLRQQEESKDDNQSSIQTSDLDEDEPGMDLHFPHYQQREKLFDQQDKLLYYEIELRRVNQSTVNVGTSFMCDDNSLILLKVRDITNLIRIFKKQSDQMYLDAIETNFSHEQMTPLNSVITNSEMVQSRLKLLINSLSRLAMRQTDESEVRDINSLVHEDRTILNLLKGCEQSGRVLQLYNKSQIVRMKIQKKQFKQKCSYEHEMDEIKQVVKPFTANLENKHISVFIMRKNKFSDDIWLDWDTYKLILFNLFQNATKYNQARGDIVIFLTCKPRASSMPPEDEEEGSTSVKNFEISKAGLKRVGHGQASPHSISSDDYVLETEILDTGIGIEKARQKLLFQPFSELKQAGSIQEVQDFNIGMGLACSHSLTKALGGDIIIKESKKELTVFSFRIPVKVKDSHSSQSGSFTRSSEREIKLTQIAGGEKELSSSLQAYFRRERINYKLGLLSEASSEKEFRLRLNRSKSVISRSPTMFLPFQDPRKSVKSKQEDRHRSQMQFEHMNKLLLNGIRIESITSEKSNHFNNSGAMASLPSIRGISNTEINQINSSSHFSKNSSKVVDMPKCYTFKDLPAEGKSPLQGDTSNHSMNQRMALNINTSNLRSTSSKKNVQDSPNYMLPSETASFQPSPRYPSRYDGALPGEFKRKSLFAQQDLQLKQRRSPGGLIPGEIGDKFGILNSGRGHSEEEAEHDKLKKRSKETSSESVGGTPEELKHIGFGFDASCSSSSSSEQIELNVNTNEQYENSNDKKSSSSSEKYAVPESSYSHQSYPLHQNWTKFSNLKEMTINKRHTLIWPEDEPAPRCNPQELEEEKEEINVKKPRHSEYLPQSPQLTKKKTSRKTRSMPSKELERKRLLTKQRRLEEEKSLEPICQCVPRILMVDDNQMNLMPLMYFAKSQGIPFMTANNGQEAVEIFRQSYQSGCGCINRAFTLIFMDIQMPIMNGIEATKRICSMLKKDDKDLTRIVGLTSFTNKREEAMGAGMVDVFEKPVGAKQLNEIVLRYFYQIHDDLLNLPSSNQEYNN